MVVHPSRSVTLVFLSKIQVVQVTIASFSLSHFLFFGFFIRDLLGVDICVGSYLALVS